MSPLVDAEEESNKWLLSERSQMIRAINDLIEEARKMSRCQRTPAKERLKWNRLTGQLILYKDSILKTVLLDVLQKEVEVLKQADESRKESSPGPRSEQP